MLRTKVALHYAKVMFIILAIHVVVYVVSPGSWLAAILPSIVVLVTLLPEKGNYQSNSVEPSDEKISESLTYRYLSKSLEEKVNEEEIMRDGKPVLGNIFSTMARNSSGNYYTEITGSGVRVIPKEDDDDESMEVDDGFDIVDEGSTPEDEHVDLSEEEEVEIQIDIDHDGKEHIIFADKTEVSEPVEVIAEYREAKESKIRKINRLNNLRNLYWMKIIKGRSVIHYRLLLSLAGHLGKLKNIVYSINDNVEVATANLRLQQFEDLLVEWLLEGRGILRGDLSHIRGDLISSPEIKEMKDSLNGEDLDKFIIETEKIVKKVENDKRYHWLKEIHDVVYTMAQEYLEDTEFLKSITYEIATFLSESIVIISNKTGPMIENENENENIDDKLVGNIETG